MTAVAANSAARTAWIDEARDVSCADVANLRGLSLRRSGAELVGACPACGGKDRFAIHVARNVFNCRGCGGKGGDAIALVQHMDGCDFLTAVEVVTGRPPPDGSGGAGVDQAALEMRARKRAEKRARSERIAEEKRQEARARAWGRWQEGGPAKGSPVEAYWRLRGLRLDPPEKCIRFHADFPYTLALDRSEYEVIHSGPAMLAAISAPDGRFSGLHVTWLDLDEPKGKARLVDRAGEALSAKKVFGTKKRCAIRLQDGPFPHLVLGEGIETTASTVDALSEAGEWPRDLAVWVAVDLGNIGGRASESVFHPHLKRVDKLGRARRVKVPGPTPAPDDVTGIVIPDFIVECLVLVDGDSEPMATANANIRFCRRNRRAGRVFRFATAPAGDFNDPLMAAAGRSGGAS